MSETEIAYRSPLTGRAYVLLSSAAPRVDSRGSISGAIAMFMDITERKKAEEALRESDSTLRSILVASPVGLVLTEDRLIKWANQEWEKMFGFENESDYVGQPTSIMYRSEAQYVTARQAVYRNLSKGIFGETYTEFLRRDGTSFQACLRSTYVDPTATSNRTISAISDITEIRQAERARLESEERYRILFEDSRDAVFVTTRNGAFLDVNQSFCHLFGYERNELKSLNVGQTYAELAQREVFQEAIEETGSIKDYPLQLRKKDGVLFEALLTASVRYGGKGEILGYQGTIRDVTEKKLLEKQLVQAQKMEAVGTLAGGIAHDFNNLLQIVLGYSEMLLLDRNKQDPHRERLLAIRQAARDGGDLVKGLLTFSRKVGINLRPINLNQEVNRIRELLSRTIPKMIDIKLFLADYLKTVSADPGQMEQVLLNLAINARDAMPAGGTLTIETRNVMLTNDYRESHLEVEPGAYILLTVSDTGSGMEHEVLEHIFEPFFTTKEPDKGTGLGLATVFGIVKAHQGHITCNSELGKGTAFRIYLPPMDVVTEPDVAMTAEMPAFGTETILLVDDENLIRNLGKEILEMAGYTVLTACNGQEALDLYRKKQADISLIILDLIMPKMGGRECLDELLDFDPNATVLIASGHAANGPVKQTLQEGAKGFISKPFETKEFLRIVRKVLGTG